MGYAKIVLAIVIALIASPTYSFICNYQKARKIGLPIFCTPVHPFQPIWWVIGPLLFPIMARMPFGIADWAKFGTVHWTFADKGRAHEKYGTAFLMVSPGATILAIDDPIAAEDCLRRINQFIKPPMLYQAIEFFGPNVDTVNGETWQRHRRLTTPPFNERNNALVWRESLNQAKGMMKNWSAQGEAGVTQTSSDTMKLALHVLASAGFGKKYDYDVGATVVPEGFQLSYRDSLAGILSNMLLAIIAAATTKIPGYLLPKSVKTMQLSQSEFKRYMVEMVEAERGIMNRNERAEENLMGALVRANDVSRADGKDRYSLTDEEIYGNLFIWNLAGHDTTANTLAYAFYLLASSIDVQEWLAEEIEQVVGDTPLEGWDYEKMFPQLKRCLALMYETLRFYGPVTAMSKDTSNTPQTLNIRGVEYTLPENYMVTINITAIMCSPKYWGPDAAIWRPSRHINDDGFITPAQGTLPAWAGGPRVCPGKKFSQVEFVAVIATALRKHRVFAVPLAGESKAVTIRRVLDTVADSDLGTAPTLKMQHPERVTLRWEAVKS